MSIGESRRANVRGKGFAALVVVGAWALAGLGSGCGGWQGLSADPAGDAGQEPQGLAQVSGGNSPSDAATQGTTPMGLDNVRLVL